MKPLEIVSGLSQWVVFAGTPYSIEISRDDPEHDWTVLVIDAEAKSIVWQHTASDDVIGLMAAISYIHAFKQSEPSTPQLVYQRAG